MRRYDTPPWLEAFTTGKEPCPLPLERLGLPQQVHGDHVEWLSRPGRSEATDAVVTDVPGLPLAVKTADCIPVLLFDTRQHRIAAVHAGWRGTVKQIVRKTIEAMGSRGADLHAIIGPGISGEAFEVGDEVYEAFRAAGFPMERIALPLKRWHIDLTEANTWLMRQCGVSEIQTDGTCTFRSPLFFSARRDGVDTGRNINCIMIKEGLV